MLWFFNSSVTGASAQNMRSLQTCTALFELPATRPSAREIFFTHLPQALVLTHESAPSDLWEPYLGHLLRPLRPLVLFGRDASLQPRCPLDHAVFFGWKDNGEQKARILQFSQHARQPGRRKFARRASYDKFISRVKWLPDADLIWQCLCSRRFLSVSPRWGVCWLVLSRCTECF